MKIIWEETDTAIKAKYDDRKNHFRNNKHLLKPNQISEDEAFVAAILASYWTIWMQEKK